MADLDNLLVSLSKDSRLLEQFEKEPTVVLADTFGNSKEFVEKYWGKETDVNATSITKIADDIRNVVTRSKIGEVGPLASTLLVAGSVMAYVACAVAAQSWSPFAYSEHNLQLSEDKIKELLEKGIIKREDVIQSGHKAI